MVNCLWWIVYGVYIIIYYVCNIIDYCILYGELFIMYDNMKEFCLYLSNIVIYRALLHVEHGEKTKGILWGIVGNFKELIRGTLKILWDI